MPDPCRLCSGETVEDEVLSCTKCHKTYHFKCGTGLSDVAQRPLERLFLQPFKCPLCTIGEKNTLVHIVLTINQIHNEGKHAQTFDLGNALDTSVQDDAAPEAVVTPPVAPPVAVVTPAAVNPAVPGPPAADNPAVPGSPAAQGPADPQVRDNATAEGHQRDGRPPLPPSLAGESLAPLHDHDESRSNKFGYLLNSFYRLPGHPNTFCGGDSHLTHLDGKEVDPVDDQVRVRSAGGLCIPATVHALAHHKRVYKKFRKVIWCLGTNDALHGREQHCAEDRVKYLRLLYSESCRIFPQASINFVLPFVGLKGVSKPFINDLERDIKSACPDMLVFRPPTMRNKIGQKGLHLNRSGRLSFIKFLRETFVTRKARVFSSDSGRSRSASTPQGTQGANTGFRVPRDTGQPTGPRFNSVSYPGVPPQGVPLTRDQGLVEDIATKVMELISQQNMLCRYYPPLPAWPPPR